MRQFTKRMLAVLASGTLLLSGSALAACGDPGPETPTPSECTQHTDVSPKDGKCDKCGADMPQEEEPKEEEPEVFSVAYRSGYTPENFSKNVQNEVTELGAGVHLVKNTLTLTTGELTSVVWAIEVDLTKANIVAGTKGNATHEFGFTKAVPYQTALDWEKATGGHVYSSLNADFFGSYCVNAFVKDGVIVKDGHNDNGNYNYLQDASDVPASAPMLFGVKGDTAQIAPILGVDGDPEDPAVKKQYVQAKLTYTLKSGSKDYEVRKDAALSSKYATLVTKGSVKFENKKGTAVKVDVSTGTVKVLEKVDAAVGDTFTVGKGYQYLVAETSLTDAEKALKALNEGDEVPLTVTSPDGSWNGYETILGCRQALVIGDEIASTVTKENTNGAQRRDIPRSAVGIKDDHTVVIFAVESLYYYNINVQEGDPHGMNLPGLAEFAYFYGCKEAANFDGGGSTQLVVKGEKDAAARTLVRSADTGTTELLDTRPVMNSILVVKR